MVCPLKRIQNLKVLRMQQKKIANISFEKSEKAQKTEKTNAEFKVKRIKYRI